MDEVPFNFLTTINNNGDGASKNNGRSSITATDATTDDGGTGEENGSIHNVGEDITDPTPDDNGKDDEHVADQKTTEEVACSTELYGLDVDPKESAEEDVRRLHSPGTRSGFTL
eukprot:scaffold2295_cov171-Chaetoceros_neogracile.AAC.3